MCLIKSQKCHSLCSFKALRIMWPPVYLFSACCLCDSYVTNLYFFSADVAMSPLSIFHTQSALLSSVDSSSQKVLHNLFLSSLAICHFHSFLHPHLFLFLQCSICKMDLKRFSLSSMGA